MAKYFRCQSGCTWCCPGGTRQEKEGDTFPLYVYAYEVEPVVTLTIGDVYRSFKFNNPEGKKFYEIFQEQFRLISMPPLQVETKELKEAERKLKEKGFTFITNPNPPRPHLVPSPKNPCYNLDDHGCKLHGSPAKYTVCRMQPEANLMQKRRELTKEDYIIFPCIRDRRLSTEQEKRTKELQAALIREEKITEKIFPVIIIEGITRKSKILPKEEEEDKKTLEEEMKKMEPFNEQRNRWWESEIEVITRNMGK